MDARIERLMPALRRSWPSRLTIGAAWALLVVAVPAQDEGDAPQADAPEAGAGEMEEIVVIAPKPGTRQRLDREYEDPVRAKLLKEFYRMRELEEEYEWRKSGKDSSSSRIKLGYDPRDEYRLRNDTALQDLAWEKNKPATLFRLEF